MSKLNIYLGNDQKAGSHVLVRRVDRSSVAIDRSVNRCDFSPGCRVIIQKLSGCDWLQCTQCKMEICVR